MNLNPEHRTLIQLLELLLKEGTDRGFGNLGICGLIERLQHRGTIGMCEAMRVSLIIMVNRPKDVPHQQHYYWPPGPEYKETRLQFLTRLLNAFKNSRPTTVKELNEIMNNNPQQIQYDKQ